MVHVDKRLILLSSKRSTHHAFLEGLLRAKRYVYDNNVVVTANGSLDINRTTRADEPVDAPLVYVASFERRYELPGLYHTEAFHDLQRRHEGTAEPQRVIYLRDPLNTLASTYSAHLKTDYFSDFGYVTDNAQQWLNLARYVLGGMDGETFVYANRFWSDEEYRRERLETLGYPDYQLSSRLSKFGGGGNTFLQDKSAAVTPDGLGSRYLVYAGDGTFLALVRHHREIFAAFCEHVGDDRLLEVVRSL